MCRTERRSEISAGEFLRTGVEISIFYRSTAEIAKFCFNLVLRAVILSLTWAALLAIGVGLNWVINWILKALNAPDIIGRILEQVVFALVLVFAIAAALTSLKDGYDLVRAGLRNSSANFQDNSQGDSDDAAQ